MKLNFAQSTKSMLFPKGNLIRENYCLG